MAQRIDVLCPHCGRAFELSLDDADRIAAQEQLVRLLERLTRQAVDELGRARQRQRERAEAEAARAESLKPVVEAVRAAMRTPVRKP